MRSRTARVAFELAPVFLVVLIPLTAHAGVLSAVAGMLGKNVVAYEAAGQKVNPGEVALLSSNTNADPHAAEGGGDIIVDEGALISGGAFGEDVIDKVSSGEISVHTVRECNSYGCETLSHIADMYGVSVKTILWANDIDDPDVVQPGDELVILPITGVRHVIKKGDTIATIAKKYDGNAEEILSYNRLASAGELVQGETIIIPGGNMHIAAPQTSARSATPVRSTGSSAPSAPSSGGYFINPLPGAIRTQGIHGYNGVDLAGVAAGTAVRAAAAGEVIVSRASGWNGGYGSYVVVKHANGTQTLYAHLSSVSVGVGASVSAGETLGGVGNTGRSTGIHLHFEVRGASNPF